MGPGLRPGAWPLRALAAAFGRVPKNAGPAAIDAYLENEAGFIATVTRTNSPEWSMTALTLRQRNRIAC